MLTPKQLRQHKIVVEALASGIDPITGVTLSDDFPYRNESVVEALLSASIALETVAQQQERVLKLPRRSSSSWSAGEDKTLIQAYDQLIPLPVIAAHHGRTEGAIRSRLIKLKAIKL